jgi:hypothetical protein
MIIKLIKPYNTKGLDADANIFYQVIKKINNNINVQITSEEEIIKNPPTNKDDIHIYISNTSKEILKYAKIKMFMINHELFYQKESDLEVLKELDYVLARNNVGAEWAKSIKNKLNLSYKVELIKFTTNFPEVNIQKTWNMFLHSAGEHHWKQTDAIIKCWNKHPELPIIVITCTDQCYRNIKDLINRNSKNILLYNYLLPKEKFIELKNKIGIHLCPSIVEGFGHYINEARKVKSLVITSDMAPMNELIHSDSGVLIKCNSIGKKKNGVDLCFINENDIFNKVKEVINLDIDKKIEMIDLSYKNFLEDTKYFEDKMKEIIYRFS